ncbi:aminotransferase class I/II-fold pyridoxal phosphate-dependent enzyme [Desulfosarcina sp. OttesenSCG-928-A07]|nr:aminotransferase class I/II-fold pyridoxal phosphate-dependent enzyme [Desulfosarcina sp. OttesenSCG-928-A07]
MISGHGGNIYALADTHGCRPTDIIDMSANVNPLGPIPEMVRYLEENLSSLMAALPEADAGAMIRAYGQEIGVHPSHIMAGNGSTELIHLIPRALEARSVLIQAPTYSDYQDACTASRIPFSLAVSRKEDNFQPDMKHLKKSAALADLAFFCNPNNPTGVLTDRKSLIDLCRSCPKTVFVIDESYLPFVSDPEAVSLVRSHMANVLVITSMSKMFRIPGLRIGFVIGPQALIARLAHYAMPWSVNSLAQAAVNWLMTHPELVRPFLYATRSQILTEKAAFIARIHAETRIRCFSSAASFILMHLPDSLTASGIWQAMADHRILIRNCANFSGLDERFIRVSMKNPDENQQAAALLAELCSQT